MIQLLFLLGLLIRILLIPLPGFLADMAFWKGWGLAAADKGIIWLIKYTNYNYPPGFAYILGFINKVYALFKSPYDVNSYWSESNVLYLFLFKILVIVSDVAVGILIYKIIKLIKNDSWGEKLGKIIALIYFLNPVTIYDGAVWGQVDQFGLMFLLAAIYLLLKNKYISSSVIFVIGCMMKYQNIIFIPLFYLLIYKKYDYKSLFKSLIVSAITFLLIILPFIVNKAMVDLIRLLTINGDYFPFYSLNAFNFWWILSGQNGMAVSDKNLVLGIINAKQFGLALFILAYFAGFISLFRSKKDDLMKKFIIGCALAVLAFFHLLTQSHERYIFPTIGLMAVYFVYLPRERFKQNVIFYLTFSILFFLNIYITMYFNYPDQTLWIFDRSTTNNLTLLLSLFQIAVFIFFLIKYVFESIKKEFKLIGAFALIIGIGLISLNIPYLLGLPISLTSIKPIDAKQDYLFPMYNKNLNTYTNPYAFDRLSSNYFFYTKGIASHANSTISYGINGEFSTFKTDYGLDSEASTTAYVVYTIIGDNKILFTSEKKGRFDYPGTISVNIKGVRNLVLKINNAGESIYGAHADWLNPVLIK